MGLLGRWSYYTQNVLELGVLLASVLLPIRLLDAVTDPIIASLFDNYQPKRWGKYRMFMAIGSVLSVIPGLVIFCYPKTDSIPFGVTVVILSASYAVITIGNTIMQTATRAGQAIITQDPKQRPIYSLGQTIIGSVFVSAFISVVITSGLFGEMQDTFVWRFSIISLSVLGVILTQENLDAFTLLRNNHRLDFFKRNTYTFN